MLSCLNVYLVVSANSALYFCHFANKLVKAGIWNHIYLFKVEWFLSIFVKKKMEQSNTLRFRIGSQPLVRARLHAPVRGRCPLERFEPAAAAVAVAAAAAAVVVAVAVAAVAVAVAAAAVVAAAAALLP